MIDLEFDDGLGAEARLRRMSRSGRQTMMTIVMVARLSSAVQTGMNHALVERFHVFRDVASAVLLMMILCAKTAIIRAIYREIAPSARASSSRRHVALGYVAARRVHIRPLFDDGRSECALLLHSLMRLGGLEASRSLRLVIVLLVRALR